MQAGRAASSLSPAFHRAEMQTRGPAAPYLACGGMARRRGRREGHAKASEAPIRRSLWAAAAATALAQIDSELPAFGYPYPIAEYAFTAQGVAMKMAYMDVKPEKPIDHTG